MAVTNWSKIGPKAQRAILEELQRMDWHQQPFWMGVDLGSPEGDMSAIAYRSPSGAVTIKTVDSTDAPIDLVEQPDGTYAPARKSGLPTRTRK